MGDAGFTPGPWWARESSSLRREGHAIVDADGGKLALTLPPGTHAEELANARLIAAAPELLGGIEDLLHQIEQGGGGIADTSLAREAIQKAKGS